MVTHSSPLVIHEAVYNFHDDTSGVKAIIAVHSSTLGPAAGGCRVLRYANDVDAMRDALNVAKLTEPQPMSWLALSFNTITQH